MAVCAVIGAQWGDEGKGKMVDYLSAEADLVIRYQGGANAGHTIVNALGTFKLRLIPSGICHPGTVCMLGPGTAVDPAVLLEEITALRRAGIDAGRVLVSERATLVMPWHVALDRLDEEFRGDRRIGTTLRGVGPAYTDKAARRGLQAGDLLDKDWLADKVASALSTINRLLAGVYGAEPFDAEAVIEQYWQYGVALREQIADTLPVVRGALARDERVLLEGQLGVLRDPDWGTYPYVTSSSPLAGSASVGAGVPPWAVTRVVGVAKAYTTAVGEGPFPAEESGAVGEYLRRRGGEFGVVTGRPRRCGWFDAVATRFSVQVAGITDMALTKLDVLDGLEELKICTGYRIGGQVVDTVPPLRFLRHAEPLFETLPGWQGSTANARTMGDLPGQARAFVARVEGLVGAPVRYLSVGADRAATLACRN